MSDIYDDSGYEAYNDALLALNRTLNKMEREHKEKRAEEKNISATEVLNELLNR